MGILDQDSRLFTEEDLKNPKIAEAYERAMPPANAIDPMIRIHVTAGGKVNEERNDTSVHPAWRKAITHTVATSDVTPVADSFRELSPNSGAYVNEVRSS